MIMRNAARLFFILCCAFASVMGHAQQPQSPLMPSPFLTDEQWLGDLLTRKRSEINKLAAERLQLNYPEIAFPRTEFGVSGRSRKREEAANNAIISNIVSIPGIAHRTTTPPTAGKRAPGAHFFLVDWSKGAASFVVGAQSIAILPEVTEYRYMGSSKPAPTGVPQIVTYWNCHPTKSLELKATFSDRERKVDRSEVSQERNVEETVRVKLEHDGGFSANGFSASHKVETEFTKVVKRRMLSVNEVLTEIDRGEERVTSISLDPLTSHEASISSMLLMQVYGFKGRALFDADLYAQIPGIWGPAKIGRLAEFIGDAERSRPLNAIVERVANQYNWVAAGKVEKYKDADLCNGSRLARETFGGVASVPVFTGAPLDDAAAIVAHGPLDISAVERVASVGAGLKTMNLQIPDLIANTSDSSQALSDAVQCRASVRGQGSLSGTDARVSHSVSISSCPHPRYSSSGRATFAIKVELMEGRSETLTGFSVAWRNESGSSFSVSDSERINLRDVRRIISVGPYHVDTCICMAN